MLTGSSLCFGRGAGEGWLWPWVAVSLGGHRGRRRVHSSSLGPRRHRWCCWHVCGLGLPLLRAGFVGTESLSSNVQQQGIEACSHVPFCYVGLQNYCPFPRFLLAWRRAKPLLAHLPSGCHFMESYGCLAPKFSFWHVFHFRLYLFLWLIKQSSETLKI